MIKSEFSDEKSNYSDLNEYVSLIIMNNQINAMRQNHTMSQISEIIEMNNKLIVENIKGEESNLLREISISFRSGCGLKSRTDIKCLLNEKVSDIIERYREKSGDNDPTKKFVFNAKDLDLSLTVAEAGLVNDSSINVYTTKCIKGAGFSMMFTDLSKNRTKEIGFSKNAPSYREVTKGINIIGICNFKKCKAYKKEVVVNIKKKKLDLIKERDELLCPECEATIIPKTVGFHLCKFVIYGKKVENRQEEDFRNEEDEAKNKDSLKYFDPELNGEVMVTELIFEVLEYL